jgi:hypothetical protein
MYQPATDLRLDSRKQFETQRTKMAEKTEKLDLITCAEHFWTFSDFFGLI